MMMRQTNILFMVGLVTLVSQAEASPRGRYDVGVLQEAGQTCPNGTTAFGLNTEDDPGNEDDMDGWVGASSSRSHGPWGQTGMWLRFCRTDGRPFRPVRDDFPSNDTNYAVLQLGAECPPGSVAFARYFDAEDDPDNSESFGTSGDIWPSEIHQSGNGTNILLRMCMFRSSMTGTPSAFPVLGMPYGVFGGPYLPGADERGWLYSDDEDTDNNNYRTGSYQGSEGFLVAGRNTKLFTARVR
jgi:hypothetical protein